MTESNNEQDLIQGVVSEDAREQRRERLKDIVSPGPDVVHVGDRFRFTIDAITFIVRERDKSTVVMRAAEIRTEADGSKTIICTPL